ncbi:MAG: hypothetical protein IJ475_00135 [Bacilli bacterium]|nr:hypothetical protein [Bacilli bacterium]
MKRLVNYFMIFVIFMLFLISKVNADTCALEQRTKLGAMAANINVVYEEVTEDVFDPDTEAYFSDYSLDVKVYNMNSQLRLVVRNNLYDDEYQLTYEDMDTEGAITLRPKDSNKRITYTFEVYGSYGDCYERKFRTIKLTLPKFNYYSQYTLCDDVSEFYMCQKYVMYDFTESDFINGVVEYKDKKIAQENELNEDGEIQSNTSTVTKVVKKVSDNKLLVSGVIIAIGIIVTIIIVVRKRRSVF